MGRANKNIISHTDSRYYRAIDGDEKEHNKALNVLCGIIEAVSIISIASTKKPIFSQRAGFSVWIIQANWYIVQRCR